MRSKGKTTNIRPGALMHVVYFKEAISPNVALGYKVPAGQVAIALFLGMVPRDGSEPMELNAAMRALGWRRIGN